MKVGIAQIAPVWLDRDATLEKMLGFVVQAADSNCTLVCFGEALLPGYPFWLERTDGARFNSSLQKELHAHYLDQAVDIDAGHLDPLRSVAAEHGIIVVAGCIERPRDRGGHSVYCSIVHIDADGAIKPTHRKLMPTYEERLAWAPGDGHGLRTHSVGEFTVGALACWENWMPLPRAALYGQGEDLHIALWPGSSRNSEDITRFLAKEGRSYVVSVSGLMRRGDIAITLPHAETIIDNSEEVLADGGSCVAAPDGTWVLEPVDGEGLFAVELDHQRVREERQNFDASGHYARADVTHLVVDRTRQAAVHFTADENAD